MRLINETRQLYCTDCRVVSSNPVQRLRHDSLGAVKKPARCVIFAMKVAIWLASAAINESAMGADYFQKRLDNILSEYQGLPDTDDVRRLVELDRELKALVGVIQGMYPDGASKKYWREEYGTLGLYIGHYSDAIGYSGRLLVDAHRRNPYSPYRKYTLFTTITGEGTSHGLGEMPDIRQAELYLHEFPTGPYAGDVNEILGYFYDDLAKVLRRIVNNDKFKEDYKYNCFLRYITSAPYPEQLRSAERLAIQHLERAIFLNPASEANDYRRDALAALRAGEIYSWHWCAD